MGQLAGFYNGKIALVDLTASTTEILPLPEKTRYEHIGGATVNAALLEYYHDGEPLVLGTGPLTGSFAPGSSLMVATFCSSKGDIHHVPFMRNAGPQLKFSGIDFMVIQGKAQHLSQIEVTNRTISIGLADQISGFTTAAAEKFLVDQRRGFTGTILLTGPAAENRYEHSCVSMGPWGSLDKVSLARFMASKNLKVIVIDGKGGIAFPEESIILGKALSKRVRDNRQKRENPAITVLEKMGADERVKKFLKKSHKRSYACYNCPFPCMSYVEFKNGDTNNAKGKKKRTGGLLLLDHTGFLALANRFRSESLEVMKACLRLGIEPSAAAERLLAEGTAEDAIKIVRKLACLNDSQNPAKTSADGAKNGALFKGHIAPKHYRLFGAGIPAIKAGHGEGITGSWERRVAMAMVLGICPLLTLIFHEVETEQLLQLISRNEQHLESLHERLAASLNFLLFN